VAWASIAPNPHAGRRPARFNGSDPSAYPASGWTVYDRIVRDAHAAGVALDLTLTSPTPRWAEGPGEPRGGFFGVWEPSAAQFGAFVKAVGTRYSGTYTPAGAKSPLPRVSFWSVWNEPNYGYDLAPQATDDSTVEVSPGRYRDLLDAAWTALQQTGHGGDTILFGETAPRGVAIGNQPGDFSGMVPLRFIRALYCVGSDYLPLRGAGAAARGCPSTAAKSARFIAHNPALFHATGFAAHLYPQGAMPPDVRTTGIPGSADYADIASLPELERTLDRVAGAYGWRRQLPIYDSEFGIHIDPPGNVGVPPSMAAEYLNWSEYISWHDRRVRSYDQYLLRNAPPPPPGAPPGYGFYTGLEDYTGKPLASYYAFRMPLFLPDGAGQPAGGSLRVWGEIRPALYAREQTGRVQRAQLQLSAGATQPFRTIRTISLSDPHGYFEIALRLAHSGRLRTAWSYPDGQRIYSRTVTVLAR
jgi:hypothetical protein